MSFCEQGLLFHFSHERLFAVWLLQIYQLKLQFSAGIHLVYRASLTLFHRLRITNIVQAPRVDETG